MSADHLHLLRATRFALRGRGRAEPNPLVGCVIVSAEGETVGCGHHEQCGEAHAEVNALRAAGARARGSTAYVTLEPCNRAGRTGPCTEALINAQVARVVIARRDPHPLAGGSAARLREAGIEVEYREDCREAVEVSDPFVHRVQTGLPWVTAKWAQTIDGRIATFDGESKWISSAASRRLVHQARGRVDAILTGIGTVLKDDPRLTARDVHARRVARRVVVDPNLRLPVDAALLRTIDAAPLTVACSPAAVRQSPDRAVQLRDRGVELVEALGDDRSLAPLLGALVEQHDATNVLVEAGPRLLASLFRERLVCDAWVFIAPLLLGDAKAPSCVTGMTARKLANGVRLRTMNLRRRSGDLIVRYKVEQ